LYTSRYPSHPQPPHHHLNPSLPHTPTRNFHHFAVIFFFLLFSNSLIFIHYIFVDIQSAGGLCLIFITAFFHCSRQPNRWIIPLFKAAHFSVDFVGYYWQINRSLTSNSTSLKRPYSTGTSDPSNVTGPTTGVILCQPVLDFDAMWAT